MTTVETEIEGPLPAAIGEVIDGYHIDSVIGRGGMGTVYQATHEKLGRKVALKMLASHLSNADEFVSRFLSEAKIVNDVRHPNIVDVFDFIELENPRRVACVMELLGGKSLTSSLSARPLTPRQAINCILQVISALESVHGLGVVHRDLKPDNIFIVAPLDTDLSFVPSVKVLDFGIAKTSKTSAKVSHKTLEGTMIGTPAYMAPEQIASEPVSPATDVYAVGEIFYEMLTGTRLYRGEQLSILKRKLMGEVPPLALPDTMGGRERVEVLVQACCAHGPKTRPSLAQVCGELEQIMELQPHETADLMPHPAQRRPTSLTAHTPLTLNTMSGVPAPGMRTKLVPAIGAFGIILAVLAIAWAAMHRPIEVISQELPPEVASAKVEEKAQPPPPAPPAERTVHLVSNPPGAAIADAASGASLGKAPMVLKFAPDQGSRKLKFTLTGYTPITVEVAADQEAMTVALAKIAAVPAPKRDDKPKREHPVENSPLKKKQLKSW